ncbi:MAG: MOSC domain-containing protein [Crocinitomicaceae bacterium]
MGNLMSIAQRKKSRSLMEELSTSVISFANGVGSDFRGKNKGKRQVTILTEESWNTTSKIYGEKIPWTVRRANLFISGFDLENSKGKKLVIGDVQLEITGELKPCNRMNEQLEGLTEILTFNWRGGVCCKIISEGVVSIGDPISLID